MAADLDVNTLWPESVGLSEAQRGEAKHALNADDDARARIAKAMDLNALQSLTADLKVKPWLDGVEIEGTWRARITQTCGVTLELFDSDLAGNIHVRALPQGSAALGGPEEHELDLDPESDDPPDALTGDRIGLGAYVVEDLSLAIDPFPRKPGVEFEQPEQTGELSPFAVLAKLKGNTPDA